MILLFLLFIVSLSQSSGSIQLAPVNSTLYASTSYTLSYFAISALPSSTNFTIDFTSSAMGITNGNLTLSATIGSTAGSGLTGACWNSKCWMRLNQATANNVKITFTFGMLRNPYFLASQQVSVMVWYNSSYNETNSYTINSIVYVPMNITLNSFTQSDYGVGNTNVTYIFNLSVPYTPAQPSLSVIIPS